MYFTENFSCTNADFTVKIFELKNNCQIRFSELQNDILIVKIGQGSRLESYFDKYN